MPQHLLIKFKINPQFVKLIIWDNIIYNDIVTHFRFIKTRPKTNV